MKKLILSTAVILGSLSIYASTNVKNEPVKMETAYQSAFTEIAISDVPAAVITALEDSYPGAVIVKAYINENGEYQLDIAVEDQTASVYSDAEGNWLKM
ncbi:MULTISPECIES: hypothetical protein [Flavobacterium]|uniref:Beta-lactamase-inhibitor-like, PepSY-like n=1 Tax=Flavobacterium salmonis TaxID=2654844 RepID=A0A6V6YXH7_9FLAO|nr:MULTISPECIES: hypothetical protein [Flavobacterium]OOV17082.1 hypothetical protein BXU10_19215 [Flavobacterium sp. LM4]CAD0003382.1 hypothetical protein FLAT13_01665 [Flavobacterium salmonis]